MKIALYHGYELGGSGSNEYTRYLARTLAELGHEVVLVCGEPHPREHAFVSRAVGHSASGPPRELFRRETDLPAAVTLHRLPDAPCLPVYLADKQRSGRVKTFPEMTRDELETYHETMLATLSRVLEDEQPDVLHANHLVYQPQVAAEACAANGVPFYIVPHGSAIEYTVRRDDRFRELAQQALARCDGVIWIAREVRERVLALFEDLREEIEAKSHNVGVGTDTSLFTPLRSPDRRAALERLKQLHVPGGKTGEQRDELRRALDRGDVDAVTRQRDAYDHKLADDDLPSRLDRIPVETDEADLVLFVGALTYGKGVQSLLAAWPAVLARRPEAHLILVGSGSYREVLEGLVHGLETGNAALFDELVRRGRDLERDAASGSLEDIERHVASPERRELLLRRGPLLRDRVHFLGRLDHPRLRLIFPCCRLAVFPSVIKEASPLVFYESMANGVLPSGTYHSGLRDGLDDLRPYLPAEVWENMGLPVEPADRVSGIAERVVSLLAAARREDLGARLRRLAEERYDWKAVAQRLVQAASAIVATHRQ